MQPDMYQVLKKALAESTLRSPLHWGQEREGAPECPTSTSPDFPPEGCGAPHLCLDHSDVFTWPHAWPMGHCLGELLGHLELVMVECCPAKFKWELEWLIRPQVNGTRSTLATKVQEISLSGKMRVLTVHLAQTHSAQSCSFYGALWTYLHLWIWTNTNTFFNLHCQCALLCNNGNKITIANTYRVLGLCHRSLHLTNTYWLILVTNPISRYCFLFVCLFSHFTNKQAGTERLSNITAVIQLVNSEIGILSQIVSFGQNIHLLCVRHGVRGGMVGMPR